MADAARTFVALSAPPSDNEVAKPTKLSRGWLRWLIRASIRLLIGLVLLLVLSLVLLYVPPVQNMVRGKAVAFLEEKTGSTVRLESLHLRFPLELTLQGLYVEDTQGDTLLYAERISTSVGLSALFHKRISLADVDLQGVRTTVRQYPDSSFNFTFIVDAFAGAKSAKDDVITDSTGGFALDMGAIHLQRVHFDLDLQPADLSIDSRIGELRVSVDSFALVPFKLHVDEMLLRATAVDVRAISGEAQPSSYPAITNPLADLNVAFNTIRSDSVRFSLTTVDKGDSLWVALRHGELIGRAFDHTRQKLALREVSVEGSYLGLVSKRSAIASDSVPVDPPWLDQHDGFRYWTQDWDLAIDHLHVAHSSIGIHTSNTFRPPSLFDSEHIVYNDIGIDAHNIFISNERIAAQLDSLELLGGPDQQRARLAVEMKATPDSVSLNHGSLSAFGNTIEFNFSAAPGDLSAVYRAPDAVPLKADVHAFLHMSQLVPVLQRMGVVLPTASVTQERWRTHLWMEGSVRNIKECGLHLDGDQGSRIHVAGNVTDAAHWPKSTYAVGVDELVMGAGVRQLVNAYAPPGTLLPQRLTMSGKVSGRFGELHSTFNVESDLGNITGKADATDWMGALPNSLSLDLAASDVDLARLAGDTAWAPMNFKLIAVGEKLDGSSRTGMFEFTPTVFGYHRNDLSSVRVNAHVRGDSVFVEMSSAAEAAKLQLHALARWPKAGDSLTTTLDLAVQQLHFNVLGVTDHFLRADGRITANVAFTSAGFGRVALRAPGFHVFNNERSFTFERFALDGLLGTDTTAITLDRDGSRMSYRANLPLDSTLELLRTRLLGAFTEPYAFHPPAGRRIDLVLDPQGTSELEKLLMPGLDRLEWKHLEGHYDSDIDALKLDVDLPRLTYDGVDVRELRVSIDATGPRLNGTLQVGQVMRDSLHVDDLLVETTNVPGALRTTLRIRDGEVDRYRIGFDLRRDNGTNVLHLHEDLVLDRQPWQAGSDNALILLNEGPRARDLFISNGAQRVDLNTDGDRLEFTGFELSNISALLNSTDSTAVMQGTLDGSMLLPIRDNVHTMADLQVSKLEVMGVPFGTMKAHVNADRSRVYGGTLSLDGPANRMTARAEVDFSAAKPHINVTSDLEFHDISAFHPFVKSYLREPVGSMTGTLRYTQDGEHVSILGYTAFADARFGLARTGSVYHLPQDTLYFDEQGLSLRSLKVLDAAGNRFQLDGHVLFAVGATPRLDLRLRTDRFLLVNNTAKDNPRFYGKLFGSMDLRINGPAGAPSVKGTVGVLDSTALEVVLPGSKVELVDHDGIVKFTTEVVAQDGLAEGTDTRMLRDSLAAQLPGVDLDLNIALDRRAHFAVVIDPTTGDQATFSGEADLVFRYNRDGDMYLQGPFTVVDGGYDVEFYGLVKKRFDLVPGGTIVWDGDPLAGRVDIQAKYRTTAAPYPLVANARGGLTEGERNTLQVRLPFDVLIKFRETLQTPGIGFGLEMDRLVRNSYPQVNGVLDQLAKPANSEELNRQVFGLLVLNTFIENESTTGTGGSSLGTTAAQNSVNSLLTQQLNRVTGEGIRGMDIALGVNTYDQTEGGQSYSRTTVDYKVTQRILNDRVSLEAGGSIGSNEKNQSMSSVSNTTAPQYAVAYSVTPDGRLRLRLYHENAYDMYDGELINNGVAIMLSRDFERHAHDRERRRQEILKKRSDKTNEGEGK